jgi:tryptophan 2,3-dioxygenase
MENNLNDKEIRKITELKKYYSDHEQEFESILEGFKNLKGVSYWDYINIDSLLSLQKPLTNFPDEMIFIVYHQITELYFKLSSHELENLIFGKNENGTPEYTESNNWMKRIGRIINHFDQLKYSFKTLMPGEKGTKNQYFDSEEFGKFRLSLAPASGFQTVSFRKLEILSTSIHNLISVDKRAEFYNHTNIEEIYDHLYWRTGGQFFDEKTNEWKPTKTLKNFREPNTNKKL